MVARALLGSTTERQALEWEMRAWRRTGGYVSAQGMDSGEENKEKSTMEKGSKTNRILNQWRSHSSL